MKFRTSFMALPVLAATALMLFPPMAFAQPERGPRVERPQGGSRGGGPADRGDRGNGPGDRGKQGNPPANRPDRPRAERPRDQNPGPRPDRPRAERPRDQNPGNRPDRPRVERPRDRDHGPGNRNDRPRVERPHHRTPPRPGPRVEHRGGHGDRRDRRPPAARAAYTQRYAQRWYHGTHFNYGPRHRPWTVAIRPAPRAGGRYQLVTRNVWIPEYTERVWIDEECFTEPSGHVYCEPGFWEVMTFGGFYEPQNHWVWQPFGRSVHVYY